MGVTLVNVVIHVQFKKQTIEISLRNIKSFIEVQKKNSEEIHKKKT